MVLDSIYVECGKREEKKNGQQITTLDVCHLHEKTDWSTVCRNGKQNSLVGNFVEDMSCSLSWDVQ